MSMGEFASVQIISCLSNMPAVGMQRAYYITRWEIANCLIAAESSNCCRKLWLLLKLWKLRKFWKLWQQQSLQKNHRILLQGLLFWAQKDVFERIFEILAQKKSNFSARIIIRYSKCHIEQMMILSKWCRDSIARAEQKYRRFFAQLVTKALQMALNRQSWTMIGALFCSACLGWRMRAGPYIGVSQYILPLS